MRIISSRDCPAVSLKETSTISGSSAFTSAMIFGARTRRTISSSAFESIFANGAVNAQPEKVRRLQTHACAVHSVLEHIRIMTTEGPRSAWVVATNVYVLGAQGWRLVSHHASPGSPREVQEIVEAASVLH